MSSMTENQINIITAVCLYLFLVFAAYKIGLFEDAYDKRLKLEAKEREKDRLKKLASKLYINY